MDIAYVIVAILSVIVIVLAIVISVISVKRIDPKRCPRTAGDFGVQTRRNVVILKSCGPVSGSGLSPIQNQDCTFPATSLSAAIDQCNSLSDKCRAFIYSPGSGTMSFIDPSVTTSNGSNDVYARQFATMVTTSA
jgi:hypothetical protein